ncbi:MAG: hypothetical protein DVB31_09710 [Verrucomicrobia bacterium]|nr:MAG: hypothetical protein DVB31_09710 [Verrucomicrobiota bacterium]
MRNRLHRAAIAVLLALLAARVSAAAPHGLGQRPPVGPFLDGTLPSSAPAISGDWSAVPAFPNLPFTNALGLAAVPGSTRLVVWEREGRVWMFENDPAVSTKTLVLDIADRCQGWDDSGLLGWAFHPDFVHNRQVFVCYTWVEPGTVVGNPQLRPPTFKSLAYHDRLSRFVLDENGVAVPGSETVFVDQAASSVWHNGGGLFFHPGDGFLYWTDGDDAVGPTQVIDQDLLSGVFRIDVDRRGGDISHPIPRQPRHGTTANYYIPNDNPFVGRAGVLEEFFALGLRSPHRMTIDPPTGRIFVGDVGNASREEIDVIEPTDPFGLNFQWSVIEGLHGDLPSPHLGANKRPVLDYGHDEGQAVIGGYVYRGKEFAADLGGRYIFGDNVRGTIWAMDETTVPYGKILLCTLPKGPGVNSGSDYTGLSSFGVDAQGELYLCQMGNLGGRIHKLARTGPPPPSRDFPPLLSQTGAFVDLASLAPSPALIPYAVNAALWSDAAVKSRWMAIPTNGTIGFAPKGEWTFPPGTILVKHFELAVDETDPGVPRRRLETRFLVRDAAGVHFGATYKWRPDNSDADLLANGLDEPIAIRGADGVRNQTWHYPSRTECIVCHSVAAGGVLGLKTRQSNLDFRFPGGITDNQLRAWNHVGLFSPAIVDSDIAGFDRLASVADAAAGLELRARSYLDANCAHCHRPGGVRALWDARFDTPLAEAGIIGGFPASNLGISGARIVVPGHPEKSVLSRRAGSLDSQSKMPPLAKNVVDAAAVAVLEAWIASVPPPPPTVPAPWSHGDIGAVGIAGAATYGGGRLTVTAGGDDIWGAIDAFHFVGQPHAGDFDVSVQVARLDPSDPWAKAGIMARESDSAGAPNAFALVTPAGIAALQWRAVATGGTSQKTGSADSGPHWVRLRRGGNEFTGYSSADGILWTPIGTATIPMAANAWVGLATTAHDNGTTTTAVYDQFDAGAGVAPLNWPPVVAMASPLPGAHSVTPGVATVVATATDDDGTVAKVEFFDGQAKIGEATSAPFRISWASPVPGTHVLAARATDDRGATATSPAVVVEVGGLQLGSVGFQIPDGPLRFQFPGQPGSDYVVEASGDLKEWRPVSTNGVVDGSVVFVDLQPGDSRRFYRVRLR